MDFLAFIQSMFPDLKQWLSCLPDRREAHKLCFPQAEALLLGICMFAFKFPSLRDFCLSARTDEFLINLGNYFKIQGIPSDDGLRYILARIEAGQINWVLKNLNETLRTRKVFKNQLILDEYDLVAMDGSGHLASSKIHHDCCLIRKYDPILNGDDNTRSPIYMHHELVLALTNKVARYTIPILYEPIRNTEKLQEFEKNDCELTAAKRALFKLRDHYPHRKFIISGDNLFAVTPIVEQLQVLGYSYLFTAKPERNKEVFFNKDFLSFKVQSLERIDHHGTRRKYNFIENVDMVATTSLASSKRPSPKTNLLEYEELSPEGELLYKNAWITNLPLNENTVIELAQAGRARFSIENRVFNVLKNHGFNIEHNYGHAGNLPEVFFGLALIALLITQMYILWTGAHPKIRASGSIARHFKNFQVLITQTILQMDFSTTGYFKFNLVDKINYNTS